MFNAVYVTIRLHYLHPITGEWDFHDGTGADQIQTKSGASPADLGSIGNNAVAMSLPKAVSFAISDATDHIGKLFGRDLNREKQMAFGVDNNLDKEADLNELKALFAVVQDLIPANDFDDIRNVIEKKQVKAYNRTKETLLKLNTQN
jgi:predicted lipid-binding transport protein (Tim44 family)